MRQLNVLFVCLNLVAISCTIPEPLGGQCANDLDLGTVDCQCVTPDTQYSKGSLGYVDPTEDYLGHCSDEFNRAVYLELGESEIYACHDYRCVAYRCPEGEVPKNKRECMSKLDCGEHAVYTALGCTCDMDYVWIGSACEKRQVCDADGQKYVEVSNTCACDDEKYWTEGDDGCVCDAHRVNRGGVCECDDENHWTEGSDGSCVCEKIFFNDQCVDVQGTVTFGNYPQATETPEPIEWIVLAHQDNKLLLLSKYVIDVHEFDASHPSENDPDTYLYPTWAESDIRKWLNDVETGFMSDAFSSAEQAMIAEVTNKTSDYMNGESVVNAGGEDSNDKVFLLDISDVQNTDYFENSEALLAYGTAHIVGRACLPKPDNSGCTSKADKNQCTHLSCHAPWWLRSPKFLTTDAGYISYDFDSSSPNDIFDSESVDDINTGVRPALWVSLSSEF